MEFLFEHNAAEILPFLRQAVHYIKEQLIAERGDKEQLLNRCKFIVTELCTNAIKHSGERESALRIYKTGKALIIERTDRGNPLKIALNDMLVSFPLPDDMDCITIMEDDINRLTMQRVSSHSARFYAEQIKPDRNSTPPQLNEHFGLIIICLSSNSLLYTFNPHNGQNTFTATIQLS